VSDTAEECQGERRVGCRRAGNCRTRHAL